MINFRNFLFCIIATLFLGVTPFTQAFADAKPAIEDGKSIGYELYEMGKKLYSELENERDFLGKVKDIGAFKNLNSLRRNLFSKLITMYANFTYDVLTYVKGMAFSKEEIVEVFSENNSDADKATAMIEYLDKQDAKRAARREKRSKK